MAGVFFPATGGSPDAYLNRAAPASTPDYTWTGYFRFSTFDAFGGGRLLNYLLAFSGGFFIEGLRQHPGGTLRVTYNGGDSGDLATLSLDTWYAWALVRDGDDLHVYLREDGQTTALLDTLTSDQTGRATGGNINICDPDHDYEVAQTLHRFFERALTQSEVEAEWDSLTPASTTDLWADWQMLNDGTSTTRRADSSGNGNGLSGFAETDYGTSDLPLVYSAAGVSLAAIGSSLTRDVSAEAPCGSDYTWLGYVRFNAWDAYAGGNILVQAFKPFGYLEGLRMYPSGQLQAQTPAGVVDLSTTLSLDTWYAWAIVHDGTDWHVYLREDGDSTALLDTLSVGTGRAGVEVLDVAEATFHEDQPNHALMRLWEGVALTQAEVEAEWDSLTPVITSGLYGDWRFANDGTLTTLRADSSGNGYHWSSTGAVGYGYVDLPLVYYGAGGPTYVDGTALGCEQSAEQAAGALSISVQASCASGDASCAFPALSAAVTVSGADRDAPTVAPAAYAAVAATSSDHERAHAAAALLIAATATAVDPVNVRAAVAAYIGAMASTSDDALDRVSTALTIYVSAIASSMDAEAPSAAISAMVSALASSLDHTAKAVTVALFASALATSRDDQRAHAAAALIVHGVATSIDDATVLLDLAYTPPDVPALSYQTRSRAVSTIARSRAVQTIARCSA